MTDDISDYLGSIFVGQEALVLSFTFNFFVTVKFHSAQGSVIGNIKKNKRGSVIQPL